MTVNRSAPGQTLLGRKKYLLTLLITANAYLILNLSSLFNYSEDVESKCLPIVCTPKTDVLFLKTHKTAGTSVQNIFMRYADAHDLLLVLPKLGNYLGHPYKFVRSMAPTLAPGFGYSIFTHHTRFNYEPMRRIMAPNATFVTILRDPVSVFESMYTFYGLHRIYNMSMPEFAALGEENGSQEDRKVTLNARYGLKFGRNQMSFDLGVNVENFDDDEVVLKAARRLNRQFHLVMIAERMEQSLVLLKELLCWSQMDVVTLKHNVRASQFKTELSFEDVERLRKINRADQLIYEYFADRFEERVEAFGQDRMRLELSKLRKKTNEMYQMCIADDNVENKALPVTSIFRSYGYQVRTFKLKNDTLDKTLCENLAKAELPYTNELYEKQKHLLI